MENISESKDYSFPVEEERILAFWDDIDAFKEQLRRTEGLPEYAYMARHGISSHRPQDIVTRYASQTGHHVTRRFGWDCHGLPVEYEIDKKFNIKSRDDVLKMGIANYNEECRSIVMRYSKEWEKTVTRLGRWIDFVNDYKTLDVKFMESVWWVFQQLYNKGLVYRGFKVMPYSTGCSTPLSNFEAGLNYKDVSDPAVMVGFELLDDPDSAMMVAWTTTPWTLPSNLALCVNPDFDYVRLRNAAKGTVLIVAENRMAHVPGAVAKKGKGGKKDEPGFEILGKVKGSELAGRRYRPLLPYFASLQQHGAFRVVADGYVTADSGTGVVHCAPAFGEDDYRVCLANGIITKGVSLPCPLDDAGCFTDEVTDFAGRYVKDADKEIIARIKADGHLIDQSVIVHSYPFCWRSEQPLLYRAVPSWFVAVEAIKDKLLANNLQTYWVPSYVQEKRFHNWLGNAHDWAISRSRFWGTPLPIWVSDDAEEVVVVGSKAELEEIAGRPVNDLHRHFIDDITIPSKQGKGLLRRVDDVFDCWFESGSMPYAYIHYPFENKKLFEDNFPADFVAEGLDQTRGWFYTLMVLSTALFDKPAFKNLVCNGLVLAADGKKMSKRLKNYPDPTEVIDRYGADALRLYLINSPVVRAETLKFSEEGVKSVIKDVFLPWYNAYRFLGQNVLRLKLVSGVDFAPNSVNLDAVTNVLDRWLVASTRHLVNFVHEEMAGYRLYTVVPFLVRFIEQLTNIYVRYNRKRLKGHPGQAEGDCENALAVLYHTLVVLCKVMAPFTPFFTESMYQNLRRIDPASPPSVHFTSIPPAVPAHEGDAHIEASVERMQRVIDLGRAIRERHNKPIRTPLKRVVVVHEDLSFLKDVSGLLCSYVSEELNVRQLDTCADPVQFANLKATPNLPVLGKRLGKAMGPVMAAVRALSTDAILAYQREGSITVEGVTLGEGEVLVSREFQYPEGRSEEDMGAAGDGEVLVVLDLVPDAELLQAGVAREFVNRVQKLRKKAGLQAIDPVEVFYELASPNGGAEAIDLEAALSAQQQVVVDTLRCPPLPMAMCPPGAVVYGQERSVIGSEEGGRVEVTIVIAVPTPAAVAKAVLQLCGGDGTLAAGVAAYLASRNPAALRAQCEACGGAVEVQVDGRRLRLVAGEHFVWNAAGLLAV